ncbi:glycosyltransferase family 1 protein [Bacillus sp. USDA818B3_A]|uniref:glycosyltransferase family 1 protein n=1 Tax=Bacillus sp. USDA818B3_A TaxID=2698834 RepID=UPI00137068F4|nr:glycosyltransferase family 1 protein [Bacillus sp. USDA818B3_A]
MNNPDRVLHIVSAMDRGGAETLLMNVYRNLDKSKCQFDFITHSTTKGDFDDEIISLGGEIFPISSLGELGPLKYVKELIRIMSRKKFAAVHSHTDFQGGFSTLAAKICGIEKRICHSHSNNWPLGKSLKSLLTLKSLQTLIRVSATNYCSCSQEAADFLFGKKLVKQGKVNLLKNGIEIQPFLNLGDCRKSVIEELKLPKDVKIVGHIGRFSESKNQSFILKVLQNLLKSDSSFIALLIGEGPLKSRIEEEAVRLGVLENIRFLGIRDDIPRLMKAFDVFLFPSIFEGFGIVMVEAQCAGTPCVVSNSVPRSTDMGLDLVSFISLESDLNLWSQEVIKKTSQKLTDSKIIASNIKKHGYSIQDNIPHWLSIYGLNKQKQANASVNL